ncbi:MAG TPA: hypothetical protein VMP68_24230 [Candidatus Eisenbacteria bacterium]|nr:hypothetical protein [Candidatus Eisenbacteria bacterium]
MGRSDICVTINRPLKFVFDVYTQPDTWAWSDIRKLAWTEGKPWEVDSRMRFEAKQSYGAVVDQVITHFEPYRRIDYISHFGGITLLSQIEFKAVSESVTEIRTQLEFIGTFSRMAGLAVGSLIEQGARKFYVDLKSYCERQPRKSLTVEDAENGR